MNSLSPQDSYFISALISEYKDHPNHLEIIYNNFRPANMSYNQFLQLVEKIQDPDTERRKYKKELERNIIKSLGLPEVEYGEHFFYQIFNRINLQYKVLQCFNTSIGEFGALYIQEKYRNQCYYEYNAEEQRMHKHEEVILEEIYIMIAKAYQEKVITQKEQDELVKYIESLKATTPKRE